MRYISMFSGIEAASVAWPPLGCTPLAFAEIERAPSAIPPHRHPPVPHPGAMSAPRHDQAEGPGNDTARRRKEKQQSEREPEGRRHGNQQGRNQGHVERK